MGGCEDAPAASLRGGCRAKWEGTMSNIVTNALGCTLTHEDLSLSADFFHSGISWQRQPARPMAHSSAMPMATPSARHRSSGTCRRSSSGATRRSLSATRPSAAARSARYSAMCGPWVYPASSRPAKLTGLITVFAPACRATALTGFSHSRNSWNGALAGDRPTRVGNRATVTRSTELAMPKSTNCRQRAVSRSIWPICPPRPSSRVSRWC